MKLTFEKQYLFELDKETNYKTCNTCDFRERHQCGSKVIQYCGFVKSNRTDNGKLKIKCKTKACYHYKELPK